jgi:hypothetical protein
MVGALRKTCVVAVLHRDCPASVSPNSIDHCIANNLPRGPDRPWIRSASGCQRLLGSKSPGLPPRMLKTRGGILSIYAKTRGFSHAAWPTDSVGLGEIRLGKKLNRSAQGLQSHETISIVLSLRSLPPPVHWLGCGRRQRPPRRSGTHLASQEKTTLFAATLAAFWRANFPAD